VIEYRTIDVPQNYTGNTWAIGVLPMLPDVPDAQNGWLFCKPIVGRFNNNNWIVRLMGVELVPLEITLMGCDIVWIVGADEHRQAFAKVLKVSPVGFRDSIPVFAAPSFIDDNGKQAFKFECPRCHKLNLHGISENGIEHRTSHCPCWKDGYYIKPV
jgi:hypothetical protein